MGEVTNVWIEELKHSVKILSEKVSHLESELARNESLVVSVADLKIMMHEHIRASADKAERLESRFMELQLKMANDIAKLQKAVLVASLGGAGAGATVMKLLGPLMGG